MRQLLSGNEAIARDIYESSISVCSAYPGTPSTEILEQAAQYKGSLYCEWAPNEKVAAEVAYGACVAGSRSLCALKTVGLNVAAAPPCLPPDTWVRAVPTWWSRRIPLS